MANPQRTRESLLNAGRTEFARYGLAGARVDRIAAQANVNKQRIYANFGNKEGFFEAVVEDALGDLLDAVSPSHTGTVEQKLGAYVKDVIEYHRKHPDLLRLLQWEALELRGDPSLTTTRAQHYREKVQVFAQHLELDEVEAAHILFAAIGLAVWPQVMPQLASLIYAQSPKTAIAQAQASAPLIAAALAGVTLKK
ncbi:MAG: TetR/AcrR family transcriptional regulator [Actinomycetaceae bacterium]|nr:TetR/AcrR family transcriptional regulator [Actinomycetaceae bacterium]